MVGYVIHECVIGSVIKEYGNVEATLSIPQYGFQKGMNVFKDFGYRATVKELDKNLIGRNVIDFLLSKSVTHNMIEMSLTYLMFLKRKRFAIKSRGCANGRSQQVFVTKLESSPPCVETHTLFLRCLDGKHWGGSMIELMVHECIIGKVIQDYGNLEATLSTPQYGFQKRMQVFKESGDEGTVNELDKNLIGRNVTEYC